MSEHTTSMLDDTSSLRCNLHASCLLRYVDAALRIRCGAMFIQDPFKARFLAFPSQTSIPAFVSTRVTTQPRTPTTPTTPTTTTMDDFAEPTPIPGMGNTTIKPAVRARYDEYAAISLSQKKHILTKP